MTKKLADSIINRIETENIKPRSKWYYRVLYGSFWGLFAIMLGLGALSFAVVLYAINHTDFDIADYVDSDGLAHLMTLMPLAWVLLIGIAIGLGIWGLRHTKRGYRLAILSVIGGNILGSMILGTFVYGAGGGEIIEEIVEDALPQYESVREKYERFWGNPKRTGRLAGLVQSINEADKTVTVSGPRGKEWIVPLERLQKAGITPEIGQPIKMKGSLNKERGFHPDRAKSAPRQKRLHQKIEKRFRDNPELKAQFESKLTPETREKIEALEEAGQRPDRELRKQIREEFEANTTLEERMEILPPREPRLEARPFRGNEDSVNPNQPQIRKNHR